MLVYNTQNSLHLAACMKHFSTPDNIESTLYLFFLFFFFLLYGCVELIFFLLLFIFVVFYAKGREASDNLYTVYTAHPFTTLPTSRPHPCLHCTRTLRRWRFSLHFLKKHTHTQPLPPKHCSASGGSWGPGWETLSPRE